MPKSYQLNQHECKELFIQGAANAGAAFWATLSSSPFCKMQNWWITPQWQPSGKSIFALRKCFSYIHYHISCYMTQAEMFYFQIFDFAHGKAETSQWLKKWELANELRKYRTSKLQPPGAELGKSLYPNSFFSLIRWREWKEERSPACLHRYSFFTWMLNYKRDAGLKSVYMFRNDTLANVSVEMGCTYIS